MKCVRSVDSWCKVRCVDEDSNEYALVDILGPVGNASVEQTVRLGESGILPCRYPKALEDFGYESDDEAGDECAFEACTYDNPGTTDMDDAISVSPDSSIIGIHITDMASVFPSAELEDLAYSWAESRTSSAYPSPTTSDGISRKVIHMLPCNIGSLVASERKSHPCISLLLNSVDGTVKWDTESRVKISRNCEYSQMPDRVRAVLWKASGSSDPAEMVAWAMTTYNLEFAKLGLPGTIYRVSTENTHACYSLDGSAGHSTFGGRPYVHATSPMRRFADFHNQRVLRNLFSGGVPVAPPQQKLNQNMGEDGGSLGSLKASSRAPDVARLNERDSIFRRFHAEDAIASLAYRCCKSPMVIKVRRCEDVEERSGSVCFEFTEETNHRKRIRVPIHDSFYASAGEGIAAVLKDVDASNASDIDVELHGIVKEGRAQLRVRRMNNSLLKD